MTITELSKELDVSTKTIQRDLYEVLSDFGSYKRGKNLEDRSKTYSR